MSKPAKNRVEMIGRTFNSWKVISIADRVNKIIYWNAECLECNKIYQVDGRNLRQGLSKRCTPCGHINGHNKQKGTVRTSRTPKETSEHYLFIKEKNRSISRRKLEWSLTEEQFIKLIYGNCNYCGDAPNNVCNPAKWSELSQKTMDGAVIIRHGIDRVDNNIGYHAENCVTACKICNRIKQAMGLADFIKHILKMAKHMLKSIGT